MEFKGCYTKAEYDEIIERQSDEVKSFNKNLDIYYSRVVTDINRGQRVRKLNKKFNLV